MKDDNDPVDEKPASAAPPPEAEGVTDPTTATLEADAEDVWDTIRTIPEELRGRDQWVVWKEESADGRTKPTKVPYNPNRPGGPTPANRASTSNPETWSSFDTAIDAGVEHGFDGVGFVFTADDPYTVIDFDDCIGEDGNMDEEVAGWVNRLDSFTEVSFSGKGLHVIVRSDPLDRGRNGGWCEMYSSGRYVALTGARLPDTPGDINDGSAAFAELHEQVARPPTAPVMDEGTEEFIILPGVDNPIISSAARIYRVMAERGDRFISSGKVAKINPKNEIQLLDDQSFRSDAERYGKLMAPRKTPQGETVYANRPMSADTAKALLAADERHTLPPLALLAELPVLVEDDGNMILTGQGYNPDLCGIYVKRKVYLDPANLDFDEAVRRLRSLLEDFDFVSPGDYARAFAGFITPALRMGGWLGVEPVPPVFVAEADESQAGKGFLQDVTAAVYGEDLHRIAKKKGGVGSLDESIASALVTGRPLLQLDNVRGKVDSQIFEMSLTSKGKIAARIPYSGNLEVDPTNRVWFITSNAMETSLDLANRSCIVRIRKRPEDYPFVEFPEGHVLDHAKANPGRYLEAVYRIILQWVSEGRPRMADTPHDFRAWARTLDWLTGYCLDVRLMGDHREVQNRVTDVALTMLREIALRLTEEDRIGETLRTHGLADICDDYEIAIPGLRDNATDDEANKQIGRRLGRVFKKTEVVRVDEFVVRRSCTKVIGGNGREIKEYTFQQP